MIIWSINCFSILSSNIIDTSGSKRIASQNGEVNFLNSEPFGFLSWFSDTAFPKFNKAKSASLPILDKATDKLFALASVAPAKDFSKPFNNASNIYVTPMGGFDGWTSKFQYFPDSMNPQQAWNIYTAGFSSWSSMFSTYQVQVSLVENGQPQSTVTI